MFQLSLKLLFLILTAGPCISQQSGGWLCADEKCSGNDPLSSLLNQKEGLLHQDFFLPRTILVKDEDLIPVVLPIDSPGPNADIKPSAPTQVIDGTTLYGVNEDAPAYLHQPTVDNRSQNSETTFPATKPPSDAPADASSNDTSTRDEGNMNTLTEPSLQKNGEELGISSTPASSISSSTPTPDVEIPKVSDASTVSDTPQSPPIGEEQSKFPANAVEKPLDGVNIKDGEPKAEKPSGGTIFGNLLSFMVDDSGEEPPDEVRERLAPAGVDGGSLVADLGKTKETKDTLVATDVQKDPTIDEVTVESVESAEIGQDAVHLADPVTLESIVKTPKKRSSPLEDTSSPPASNALKNSPVDAFNGSSTLDSTAVNDGPARGMIESNETTYSEEKMTYSVSNSSEEISSSKPMPSPAAEGVGDSSAAESDEPPQNDVKIPQNVSTGANLIDSSALQAGALNSSEELPSSNSISSPAADKVVDPSTAKPGDLPQSSLRTPQVTPSDTNPTSIDSSALQAGTSNGSVEVSSSKPTSTPVAKQLDDSSAAKPAELLQNNVESSRNKLLDADSNSTHPATDPNPQGILQSKSTSSPAAERIVESSPAKPAELPQNIAESSQANIAGETNSSSDDSAKQPIAKAEPPFKYPMAPNYVPEASTTISPESDEAKRVGRKVPSIDETSPAVDASISPEEIIAPAGSSDSNPSNRHFDSTSGPEISHEPKQSPVEHDSSQASDPGIARTESTDNLETFPAGLDQDSAVPPSDSAVPSSDPTMTSVNSEVPSSDPAFPSQPSNFDIPPTQPDLVEEQPWYSSILNLYSNLQHTFSSSSPAEDDVAAPEYRASEEPAKGDLLNIFYASIEESTAARAKLENECTQLKKEKETICIEKEILESSLQKYQRLQPSQSLDEWLDAKEVRVALLACEKRIDEFKEKEESLVKEKSTLEALEMNGDGANGVTSQFGPTTSPPPPFMMFHPQPGEFVPPPPLVPLPPSPSSRLSRPPPLGRISSPPPLRRIASPPPMVGDFTPPPPLVPYPMFMPPSASPPLPHVIQKPQPLMDGMHHRTQTGRYFKGSSASWPITELIANSKQITTSYPTSLPSWTSLEIRNPIQNRTPLPNRSPFLS
ncbi:unnamed protein product [Nesidiocoris tenuis]|uniref:Uncharacterized protein n=1 Tax=Nesidiocoris tenuis TaxID=355587 RepID=A0A6H5HL63_9HEMI|nr:unnamed protein product [Nesidiocoris tenuis]